ncbi:protein trichome berefringence-like 7 isoform X2 [Syzygium oleosum]|uniref:protein trichome berefringence-like 7 isoform X2 n=1 Tax=Syzygium oleosum TaxID=219896 RepID=UPI0024BB73B8|nr:protein trichome berefringence-like 7 isoform X2 [Syzygium oleosum]
MRPLFKRGVSFACQMVTDHCKVRVFGPINGFTAMGSLFSFLVAITCACLFVLPIFEPAIYTSEIPKTSGLNSMRTCNVFEGSWIPEESYPLYNASQCPFAERGFNCLANGRRDRGYTKWRWKPKHCDIPQFDVLAILEYLRGKRIVFVGDSLSRTQWESFICMLMTGVDDKRSVYEINGNQITKQIRFLSVGFSSYNLRVDFYRSAFLVQPGPVPKRAPKRVKSTIRLDKLDDISKEWIDSDFLIFNSGHWWTPTKLFEMGCYFQHGGSLKLGMPIASAFKAALNTWASWVESNVNPNRTSVFFRTFESSHWSGRRRNSCKVTRRPSSKTNGRDKSSISDIIMKVAKQMAFPIHMLHVTPMGAFRSDAHVGTWSDNPSVPDCSHWCLPGVPDMWNEILFSYMLSKNGELFQ